MEAIGCKPLSYLQKPIALSNMSHAIHIESHKSCDLLSSNLGKPLLHDPCHISDLANRVKEAATNIEAVVVPFISLVTFISFISHFAIIYIVEPVLTTRFLLYSWKSTTEYYSNESLVLS